MIEQLLKKTQMEGELKNLYSIPHPKSRETLERKHELEVNLEIINKNIQSMKDKIK